MSTPHLACSRCLVRMAMPGEGPKILAYYADNGARYRPALPASLLNVAYWEERILLAYKDLVDDTAVKLFVFNPEGSRVMGTLAFSNVVRGFFHRCSLGYAIASSHEGQGIMYEAAAAAIDWIFSEKNIYRIEATYETGNTRSASLLNRLGFVHEGIARGSIHIDGKWLDQEQASLLNPAWKTL